MRVSIDQVADGLLDFLAGRRLDPATIRLVIARMLARLEERADALALRASKPVVSTRPRDARGTRYPGLREFVAAEYARDPEILLRDLHARTRARWLDPTPSNQVVSYHLQAVRKAAANENARSAA